MATRRERVFYEMTATDNASRVFRQVEGSAQRLGGAYRAVQAAVLLLASGGFLSVLVSATKQAEQSQNRLTAVLKATGNQVGITRAKLDDMADAMAASTQFDDESLRNAQSQLIKFGNIQGQVFRDALKISADLAAFMGVELTSAASNVGRALSAPVQGLENLQTHIGRVTDAETKLLKTLTAQGRAVEAQNEVLRILQERLGGTAEIMNTGATKATEDWKKAWDDLFETLGREGTILTRTIQGAATLTKDLERELRGVRTPLGDLAQDSLEWLAVLRFLPGAISQVGHAAYRAQLNMDKQRRTVSGTIRNPALEDVAAFEAGLAATPRVPIQLLGKIDDPNKSKRDAAAKARADALAQQDEQFALFSQMAQEREDAFGGLEEALKLFDKDAGEQRKQSMQDWEQQVAQLAERYQMAADREAEFTDPSKLEGMLDSLKKVKQAATELGWAFSSAFEDAIIEGGKLRDVLQGLAKDVARIVLRQTVTQPMATALAGVLGGMFGGGTSNSPAFGAAGARAAGGPVIGGRAYLVGERGPELFMPHQGGQIIPNGAGGVTVNISMPFSANTPAAVRDAMMAAAPMLTEAAKRGVLEARARGAG